MTKNINDFNKIAAQLFDILLKTFPVRTKISEEEFFGYKPIDFHPTKGRLLTDKQKYEFKMLSETIIWLGESGFIRYQDEQHEKSDLVLTEKGLELFKLNLNALNSDTICDTTISLRKV